MESYFLENPQVATTLLIGVVGLIVTGWFNKNNQKIAHQKLEKELFTEFNKRYDELNDSLMLLEGISTVEQLKSTSSLIANKSMYNILIDYFNLCAEQYYWKKNKRISAEIWTAWHQGMNDYYKKYEVLRKVWAEETKDEQYQSYYLNKKNGFFPV